MLGKLVSPRFHFAFAVSRTRSFWSESARSEKVCALALYGLTIAATVLSGTWPALLVIWFVPLIPLFQMSNTLRLCVKHTFPEPGVEVRHGREYFSSLTNAIFIGDPIPYAGLPFGRRLAAWVRWTLRLVFLHVPSRYLVLTGDTVVHDYHHRYPAARNWANYILARQQDVDDGHCGWPPHHEVWASSPPSATSSTRCPARTPRSSTSTISRRSASANFSRLSMTDDRYVGQGNRSMQSQQATSSRTVILGGAASGSHAVANHLIAYSLRGTGFDVVNLGTCTPVEEFAAACDEHPDAEAVIIGSLNGHIHEDLRGLAEAKSSGRIACPVVVGGNLSVGSHKDASARERLYALGVDHILAEPADLPALLDELRAARDHTAAPLRTAS
ncbi:hypothetical protein [Streptomyces decoyicus]|uniref:hypothetical protein n=1 Tax=Streptomyces decoyicus TaxID=249567 RepID=UPI003646B504